MVPPIREEVVVEYRVPETPLLSQFLGWYKASVVDISIPRHKDRVETILRAPVAHNTGEHDLLGIIRNEWPYLIYSTPKSSIWALNDLRGRHTVFKGPHEVRESGVVKLLAECPEFRGVVLLTTC